jgi:hypothetical protein
VSGTSHDLEWTGLDSDPDLVQHSLSLKDQIAALSDEERLDLFAGYCWFCGVPVPPTCHCMNDE